MKLKAIKAVYVGIALSVMGYAAPSFADSFSNGSTNFQHVAWNNLPIPVDIQVGQQRVVQFPDAVAYRFVPGSTIDSSAISFINADNTLYITANSEFQTAQLEVRDTVTNKIFILNLTGIDSSVVNTPLSVVISSGAGSSSNSAASSMGQVPLESTSNYITFARYSFDFLYSPNGMQQLDTGMYSRYPLNMSDTTASVQFYADPSVMAMPIAEWTDGNIYTTVLELRNMSKQPISLDPRLYLGNWLASSTFPIYNLQAAGTSLADTTDVLVLSRDPFVKAINEPDMTSGLIQSMNLLGGGQNE